MNRGPETRLIRCEANRGSRSMLDGVRRRLDQFHSDGSTALVGSANDSHTLALLNIMRINASLVSFITRQLQAAAHFYAFFIAVDT